MSDQATLTPDLLLHAYSIGIFPMAEGRDDPEVFWVDPQKRGVIPLGGLHVSRSLRRALRNCGYDIAINRDFPAVVRGCADRAETWINAPLFELYCALHERGHAHSQEVWDNGTLVGGVFGITLGGAFIGESMFSARKNTSKIAMVYLCDRLVRGGFHLFDTQFLTPHLASLGGVEIPRAAYRELLSDALKTSADFTAPAARAPQDVLQRSTQTS